MKKINFKTEADFILKKPFFVSKAAKSYYLIQWFFRKKIHLNLIN